MGQIHFEMRDEAGVWIHCSLTFTNPTSHVNSTRFRYGSSSYDLQPTGSRDSSGRSFLLRWSQGLPSTPRPRRLPSTLTTPPRNDLEGVTVFQSFGWILRLKTIS